MDLKYRLLEQRRLTRFLAKEGPADVFKDADVHSLDEGRTARRATVVRDDDDEGEEPRR
jgi:hypothetical protein